MRASVYVEAQQSPLAPVGLGDAALGPRPVWDSVGAQHAAPLPPTGAVCRRKRQCQNVAQTHA